MYAKQFAQIMMVEAAPVCDLNGVEHIEECRRKAHMMKSE